MAREQKADRSHHFAVTMANLAYNSVSKIASKTRRGRSTTRWKLSKHFRADGTASAIMAKAQFLHGSAGCPSEGADRLTVDGDAGYQHNETYAEAADALDSFASRESALAILDRVGHHSTVTTADRRLLALTKARLFSDGVNLMKPEALADYPPGSRRWLASGPLEVTHAYLKVARGDEDAGKAATWQPSRRQRKAPMPCGASASSCRDCCWARGAEPGHPYDRPSYPWHLTFLADLLATRLASVSSEAQEVVAHAARLHPERWRTACVKRSREMDGPAAAAAYSRRSVTSPTSLGFVGWRRLAGGRERRQSRAFARPTPAAPVRIEDQGRVAISSAIAIRRDNRAEKGPRPSVLPNHQGGHVCHPGSGPRCLVARIGP